MTLKTNALISVEEMISSMGLLRNDIAQNFIEIYNSSSDATSATVTITSATINLVVVGGANAHNTTITLTGASYDTISELVTAIEALAKGWIVNRLCASGQTSTYLFATSVSCLLVANKQTLQGFNGLLLEECINSASNQIENYCHRKFVSAVYTEYYDGTSTIYLKLDNYPVTTLTSVEIWDYATQAVLQTLTNHQDYELMEDEGMIYQSSGFARGKKNYKIVYTAGYSTATMPEDLKNACKELGKMEYFKRDKQGVAAERIGQYSINYVNDGSLSSQGGLQLPTNIVLLLAPFMRYDRKYREEIA
ncbi:hypothetical protein C0389_06845 [bacterium]|nr:hypothetical protein [bacterium]